jgi:hypothetical protein
MNHFTYHRFTTTIYDRTGEGPTLYSGDNLGVAVRMARGVKVGSGQTVRITDHNKVDQDDTGAVPFEDFAEGEDLAIDVAEYLC